MSTCGAMDLFHIWKVKRMNYKKMKEIMQSKNFTVEDLSKASRIPIGTLSKIVCGITPNPRYNTMEEVASSLNCSLDEFSGREPMVSYSYEDYIQKFKRLPAHQKEYIKYVINLEYDRMVSLTSSGKKSMKCFEFTSVEDGLADYGSQKVHDVWVEQNPLTRECTFFVWVRTSNLEPKFCRNSVLGFQYLDGRLPKHGEIWMFLRSGYLYIGRYFKRHGVQFLRSLNGTIDDELITNSLEYKRVGRYFFTIDLPDLTSTV